MLPVHCKNNQAFENCDGDYKAVARRKQHSRRSDCVCTAEFLKNLQKKVLEEPGIRIMALSRELNVSSSTMRLALNEDLCYHSYWKNQASELGLCHVN